MGQDQNLYERGGIWYCRRQVPKELTHLYKGKTDLRKSLMTRDIRDARRRSHSAMAAWDAEFDEKRRELNREADERAFVESPRFQRLQEDTYRAALSAEAIGGWADAPRDRKEALTLLDEALADNGYWLARGIDLAQGVHPDGEPLWGCPVRMVDFLREKAREFLEAERASLLAKKVHLSEQQDNAPFEDTLEALIPLWTAESKPVNNSILEMKRAVRLFHEVNGPIPYRTIAPEHGRQFKTYLLGLDKASASVAKHWTFIRILLNIAKGNSLIEHHPLDGIKFAPGKDSKPRDDFTSSDLVSVFSELKKGTEDWWEVRICLYTGARQGEVHQLTRADVREDEGVLCFDFNEEGEGKSLKTRNSRRLVPVHRQLLEDGLLDWLPEAGSIFQGRKQAASQRLNRAIRKAQLQGNKVVHSARHTFKSAAREAGLGDDIHDRLTGHTSQHVGRSYGRHSMPSLKKAIDQIRFGIETVGGTEGELNR